MIVYRQNNRYDRRRSERDTRGSCRLRSISPCRRGNNDETKKRRASRHALRVFRRCRFPSSVRARARPHTIARVDVLIMKIYTETRARARAIVFGRRTPCAGRSGEDKYLHERPGVARTASSSSAFIYRARRRRLY